MSSLVKELPKTRYSSFFPIFSFSVKTLSSTFLFPFDSCLQETKVIDKDFPRQPFEELGYHTYIYGQKAYNGVAIFSRQPMTDIITGFTDIVGEEKAQSFDEQKRIISGVIDDIRIINVYVPNGASLGSEKYEYKLQWFQVLKAYLDDLILKEAREVCICGDFNIALDDKDI